MATRRDIRLRREFLFRKGLEGKERDEFEKKRKLERAEEGDYHRCTDQIEGKKIPTELREEEPELSKEMRFEDEETKKKVISHQDDEYQDVGVYEPKIYLTTSRDPSSRLIQFSKEIAKIMPNTLKQNRGNHKIGEIVEACKADEFTDLIVLHETRGEPDALLITHFPFGPTIYFTLSNVVMRHDLKETVPISEQAPHLIFHNFTTKLGDRVSQILKSLFPIPKEDSTRILTFYNDNDYISFRHHNYKKAGKDVILTEVGPRFDMRPFQIKLGTVDLETAENEWVYNPYLNTANKKSYL